ncbi:hypothetical protein AJ79_04411 [Helicocarpus griseus UAMH5409]|uniref:Uncharacterized protein n=1 Tax=Helicocarpus griseus UAMH5409 TaxID=1447875 RepID=A0A2B7XTY7_9EURO|nr:hypothetical protein AJ79_04411 [Helicocarpus griseus UAMH5409]
MPDSLAAFRGTTRQELSDLAQEHMKHDLQPEDRDKLKSASSKLGTHATLGSLLGIGLGMYMAFRIRRARMDMFNAFRLAEKPTHMQFANGRTETVPDLTPYLRPTTIGDMAMFTFFSAGGLFLGGETGLACGVWSARRTISKDPESKKRIENAFAKLRADILRRQADKLDGGKTVPEKVADIF